MMILLKNVHLLSVMLFYRFLFMLLNISNFIRLHVFKVKPVIGYMCVSYVFCSDLAVLGLLESIDFFFFAGLVILILLLFEYIFK